MSDKHETLIIMWSKQDESYIATSPEVPGLSAFGDTRPDAIQEAETAIEGFESVTREDRYRHNNE